MRKKSPFGGRDNEKTVCVDSGSVSAGTSGPRGGLYTDWKSGGAGGHFPESQRKLYPDGGSGYVRCGVAVF